MQGTLIQSLVQGDPTCHGATKPVYHNYWDGALEPVSHNYWSVQALEPMLRNKSRQHNEKPTHCKSSAPLQLEKSLCSN